MKNEQINLYDKIENGGLGTCHLLKKKKGGCNGEVYLLYSETNPQHFIVCEGISDDNYFNYAQYFNSLEFAFDEFKTIK